LIGGFFWSYRADEKYLWMATRAWRESVVVRAAREFASGPIYSNLAPIVYVYTGNARVYGLPRRRDFTSGAAYREGLQRSIEDMRRRGGVMIYFDRIEYLEGLPLEEVRRFPGLVALVESELGGIYKASTD
jgi:hypothetical protein